MGELTADVNWLAVVAGFLAAYALGFLWYGALFRKAWASGHGLAAPPERQPVAAMVLQAVGTFLLAWLFGVTAVREQLLTIVLVVLCIMALMAAGTLFTLKPFRVAAIETGYVLAAAVVLFLAQAAL
jgi:hypothetical protein